MIRTEDYVFVGDYKVKYEKIHGKTPKGIHLHHMCRNHKCSNVKHLVPLSVSEHHQRHSWQKIKSYVDSTGRQCVQPVPFTVEETIEEENRLLVGANPYDVLEELVKVLEQLEKGA